MKKKVKIEGKLRDVIPNPAVIPCTYLNSEKLRKEHGRWREEMDKNRCKNFSDLHYWENVSICNA